MTDKHASETLTFTAALAGWFFLSVFLALHGAFTGNADQPPIMLGLGVATPVLVMLFLYGRKKIFWNFLQAIELRTLVLLNIWRFVGIDFLLHYANGTLPGSFAYPAGIGDILVAVGAFHVIYLLDNKATNARKTFVIWNVLSALDLVVAVTMGVLNSQSAFGLLASPDVTTRIMTELPHSLVPTFFVPLFFTLHLIMLRRAKELHDSTQSHS